MVGQGLELSETAVLIENRQQRHTNTDLLRRADDALRKFCRIVIRLPVGIVVHIVKFAHRRVTGLEHLNVQMAADSLQMLRL
ncbi:hypothetical protein D3C72_2187710 [compost metagenome]